MNSNIVSNANQYVQSWVSYGCQSAKSAYQKLKNTSTKNKLIAAATIAAFSSIAYFATRKSSRLTINSIFTSSHQTEASVKEIYKAGSHLLQRKQNEDAIRTFLQIAKKDRSEIRDDEVKAYASSIINCLAFHCNSQSSTVFGNQLEREKTIGKLFENLDSLSLHDMPHDNDTSTHRLCFYRLNIIYAQRLKEGGFTRKAIAKLAMVLEDEAYKEYTSKLPKLSAAGIDLLRDLRKKESEEIRL